MIIYVLDYLILLLLLLFYNKNGHIHLLYVCKSIIPYYIYFIYNYKNDSFFYYMMILYSNSTNQGVITMYNELLPMTCMLIIMLPLHTESLYRLISRICKHYTILYFFTHPFITRIVMLSSPYKTIKMTSSNCILYMYVLSLSPFSG